jgi:hypothetical protein
MHHRSRVNEYREVPIGDATEQQNRSERIDMSWGSLASIR